MTPLDTLGGVSNVDMDGNNALFIKAIQVFISTFETLPMYIPITCAIYRGAYIRQAPDTRMTVMG
jgi:hypothetical protein